MKEQRRRHRHWWERWFIEPIYFWLDLYGQDSRPSHRKVLTAWGFFFALGAEFWIGIKADSMADITWPYVTLVIVTLSMAFGVSAFKAALHLKSNEE